MPGSQQGVVCKPDGSANASSLVRSHGDTGERLEQSDSQPRGLDKSVVQILGLLVKKAVAYFVNYYLNLCFLLNVPFRLLLYLPPMQPECRQTVPLPASDTLCCPPRARCGSGDEVLGEVMGRT